MKRILITFLILVLLSSTAYGAAMKKKTIADEVELSATTENTGWLQNYVANADRVAYFVNIDTSATTVPVTADVTIQASADGTDWADISWLDLAGGPATYQINESLTAVADTDEMNYIMWLDTSIAMPHLRFKVVVDAGNWDEDANVGNDDTIDVTITIVEDK